MTFDPKDPRQDPTSVPPVSGPERALTVNFNEAVLRALDDLRNGQAKHDIHYDSLEKKIDGLTEHDKQQRGALKSVQDMLTDQGRQIVELRGGVQRAQADATKALAKNTDTRDMIETTVAAVQVSTNGLATKVAEADLKQTTSLSNLAAVNDKQTEKLETTATKVATTAAKVDDVSTMVTKIRFYSPVFNAVAIAVAVAIASAVTAYQAAHPTPPATFQAPPPRQGMP